MNTQKLKELRGSLGETRKQLAEVFEQAGPDMDMSAVKCIEGDSAAKVDKIKSLNAEATAKAKELEPFEAEYAEMVAAKRQAEQYEEKGAPAPVGGAKQERQAEEKSLGDLFIEHNVGGLKGREIELPDVEMKTLFQTTAGWTPETTRTGRLVDLAQTTQDLRLTDVVPSGSTNQSAVVYMQEVTYTNNVATVKEGAAKPEVALKVEEKTSTVRKIAGWIPVTDEQLEDEPQVRSYINNRLTLMVRQHLNKQIAVGAGSEAELTGFLNTENVQTQAKGSDPTPDAVYKAITKVAVTGDAAASAVVFHPNDWQEVRLLRTEDGIYIWGSPSDAGPERIWGLPVIKERGMTEGTALVGDFQGYSELPIRRGISLSVSDSHEDYFVKNKQVILAEMRTAFVVYRPAAFCTVTGV